VCENPWSLNREPLTAEARGKTISHEVSDRHLVLLPSDSTSLTTYLEEHEMRFDVVTVDLPPLPKDLSQVAEAKKWLHQSVGLFELGKSRLTDDGRVIVRADSRSLVHILALVPGLHLQRCISWHKASNQQQSSKFISPVHDLVMVLGTEPVGREPAVEYLSWKRDGKSWCRSEHVARRFPKTVNDLRLPHGTSPPEALKPVALYEWLCNELCSRTESFLDLTSCGGSWTHHLGPEVSKVDVIWADGNDDDGLVSLWLLLAMSGNRFDKLDKTFSKQRSLNGDFESGDCDCHIARPSSPLPDPHPVRIARGHPSERVGARDDLTATLRGSEGLVLASFSSHLSGHLDQLLIPVSVAVNNQPATWSAMSERGVLYLELDEDWPQHLQVLYAATDPETWLGTLVFRQGDIEFGPAKMVAVVAPNPGRSTEIHVGEPPSREYEHDDHDPRGPWRAPNFKDAPKGGPGTQYTIHEPPYDWRQPAGSTSLPDGLWRVSPEGFIWGTPNFEGACQVEVEVEDAAGNTATGKLQIEIDGSTSAEPDQTDLVVVGGNDAWFFEGIRGTDGPLEIVTNTVTVPFGKEVSIVLNAGGGQPFHGEIEPPKRYWATNKTNLLKYLREDRLVWNKPSKGKKVRPKPRRKTYKSDDEVKEGSSTPRAARSVVDESSWKPSGGIAFWLRRYHPDVTTGSVTKAEDGVVLEVLSGSKTPAVELWLEGCANCAQAGSPGGCNTPHSLDDLGLLRCSAEDETEQSWRAQLPDWLSFTVARDVLGTQHVLVLEEAPLTNRLRAAIDDVADPPVSLVVCVRIGGNASSGPPHKRLAIG
jgi:hypothetical protein